MQNALGPADQTGAFPSWAATSGNSALSVISGGAPDGVSNSLKATLTAAGTDGAKVTLGAAQGNLLNVCAQAKVDSGTVSAYVAKAQYFSGQAGTGTSLGTQVFTSSASPGASFASETAQFVAPPGACSVTVTVAITASTAASAEFAFPHIGVPG